MFAIGRVVPDLVRSVYPLHVFDYVTDGDGIVVSAHPQPTPASRPNTRQRAKPQAHTVPATKAAEAQPQAEAAITGDRVRIDLIKPFDRKPGLAGSGFAYDNPERSLPVERAGHVRTLHLAAREESPASRFFAVLRIVLFVVSVVLVRYFFSSSRASRRGRSSSFASAEKRRRPISIS